MRLTLLTLLLLQSFLMTAQDTPTKAIVRDFIFEGNAKTKNKVLVRELTFRIGDTIPLSELATKLEENRLRLLNTGMFTEVKINVKNWGNDDKVNVVITLDERWYFYPIPIFELADRDLNVWWKQHNHDLRRSNVGLRLTHTNITGRRDAFATVMQVGYTPKFALGYSVPYLNKKQTIGAYIGTFYATNREVGYQTDSNIVVFFRDSTAISVRTNYNAGINYSPGLYHRFSWSAGFNKQVLAQSVVDRNADFFLNNRTTQAYFWLNFDYSHDTRDFRASPTKGHSINVSISKSGLFKGDDVNALNLSARWSQFFKLHTNLTWATIVQGKTALIRQTQPYSFQGAIGSNSDYLHGYELFTVNGIDYGVLKNSLRFCFLNKNYDLTIPGIKNKFLNSFSSLPIQLFLSGNFDAGYAYTPQYNPTNTFSNRLLYGGGIGLEILAYRGLLWQLEYSFNHTGQGGFYVHYRSNF